MKTLLKNWYSHVVILIAAALMMVAGCATTPSTDTLQITSYAVGNAAARVANLSNITDESRAAIIEAMTECATVLPQEGQTFADVWSNIAARRIQHLVTEGKLNETYAPIVTKIINVAINGIDHVVDTRWPAIRNTEAAIAAVSQGFCDGFLDRFSPSNERMTSASAIRNDEPDAEAMAYMLRLMD